MQNVDHQHAQNTQYRSGVDGSVGGRVGGRPRRRAFHKTGTNGNLGDTQPRLTIRLSSPCHLDPVICSHGERRPGFRLISGPLVPTKKGRGSALCLAQGTAIPNKLGPVGEGREDRHPAKTSGPPPLPRTGIRAQPCH